MGVCAGGDGFNDVAFGELECFEGVFEAEVRGGGDLISWDGVDLPDALFVFFVAFLSDSERQADACCEQGVANRPDHCVRVV